MRFQSRCQLGLQHLKAGLGLEGLCPRRSLPWLWAGELSSSLAVGWRTQFLAMWTFPQFLECPYYMAAGFSQKSSEIEGETEQHLVIPSFRSHLPSFLPFPTGLQTDRNTIWEGNVQGHEYHDAGGHCRLF